MKINILTQSGYCSGVSNAINTTLKVRKENPETDIFVMGELVHNFHVIELLKSKKIVNLIGNYDDFSNINPGSIVIFSAHGHDKKLDKKAKKLGLKIIDCVCPNVSKNISQIENKIKNGYEVIYVGIPNHPEANASLSISEKIHFYDAQNECFSFFETNKPVFVTNQTTLNVLNLSKIFEKIQSFYPDAEINNEICAATRIRQEAIQKLDNSVDTVIVVGDKNSSNSNRLYEISKAHNKNASTYFVSNESEITQDMVLNKNHIVIASGTSTPNDIVKKVALKIEKLSK